MPVSILIADDHAVVRDGLKMILETADGLRVVAMAADGREAISMAEIHRPDVIIMDISMPGLNGIEAARMIHEHLPAVRILILSMHHSLEHIHRALQAGVQGYLLKESAGNEVVTAVRTVMTGKLFFGKGVEKHQEGTPGRKGASAKSPLETLSQREREVLQLVVEGKTSVAIATFLSLSPKSVETYRSRLMIKLGVDNIPALVKFALEHGITPTS